MKLFPLLAIALLVGASAQADERRVYVACEISDLEAGRKTNFNSGSVGYGEQAKGLKLNDTAGKYSANVNIINLDGPRWSLPIVVNLYAEILNEQGQTVASILTDDTAPTWSGPELGAFVDGKKVALLKCSPKRKF